MKPHAILFLTLLTTTTHVALSQTNLFPLYSGGAYSGGVTSDLTDITNAQLKLQATSGYIRLPHLSADPAVSTVYNFEAGKYVYWGEPADGGKYVFRGRDMMLQNGGFLQNSENAAFAVDATTNARLGIIKKVGFNPMIVSDNISPILFGQTNQTGVQTNISGATLTERMRIEANGWVKIGGGTPRGKFDVDGPGDIYLTDDANEGINQSIFLPGHIYLAPYSGTDISFLQARRLNDTGSTSLRIRTYNNGTLTDAMHIEPDGDVGIGTTHPDAKLTVKGDIHTREVRVDMTGPLVPPDYVFEKDYNLLPLAEVEAYINENKHLPEVPSAKEMEANGLNLKEMNLLLLKKVEELTLHLIEANKKIEHLDNEVKSLKTTPK